MGRPRKQWLAICLDQLDEGKIEALVNTLRDRHPANEELVKEVVTQGDYFERNAECMRYPVFRAQGLFVGSGVIDRPPLLPSQRPLRKLLQGAVTRRLMVNNYVAHPGVSEAVKEPRGQVGRLTLRARRAG